MTFAFAPLSRTLPHWPAQLFGDSGGLLDDIGVTEFAVQHDDTSFAISGKLGWLRELDFKAPGFDALSISILSGGEFTEMAFSIAVLPSLALTIPSLNAALRLRSPFLRPMKPQSGKWVPDNDTNGDPNPLEIELSGVSAAVTAEGDISVVGAPSLSLTPFEIGTTGIIIDTTGLQLYLDARAPPPPGEEPGFKGVAITTANVHLTGDLAGAAAPTGVQIDDLLIGSSGFSGKLRVDWAPGNSSQLFGMDIELEKLEVEFRHNVPVGGGITAVLTVPFLDERVAVEIGYTATGGMVVGLKSPAGDPPGIYTLTLGQVLELKLDSLKITIDDGLMSVALSGTAKPLVAALKCPPIRIDNLTIDSKGRVNLPGGWLPLPQQYELKFHSFRIAITKFGFGRNDDGTKWIGLSGGIKLIDALPAGVSVDGLRIVTNDDWSDPRFTLTGVGVELDIKDVLYFKGAVAYRAQGNRFDGAITLELRALDFRIDGKFVVGDETNQNQVTYRYMALFVDVDLPTGLPLMNTGLAVFGMAGLFALRMRPDKRADEDWYEIPAGKGWYKRDTPGITDINKKWAPEFGSKGFGVGMTFGTLADSGYTFNGKAMFVAVFPGPLLLLSGAANLLKDRAKLGDDPLFRSLAVYDRSGGTLQIGVDLKYRYNDDGKLLAITAGTEAFYDFNDPSAWRINLGIRTPTERRIQARVFDLFDAKAYLMLSAHEMAMGAWVGYDRKWKFGPLKVGLSAWMESNVKVSFKPPQLYGDMALHGAVELEAFSFGLNLSIDAAVQAQVFRPKHILAELEVKLQLPSLRKKKGRALKGHCRIEFGPDKLPPPIPLALKGVSIEHFKTSATWPLLASEGALKPQYDDGQGFLIAPADTALTPPPEEKIPIVPVDCRPSLQFARNVHDDAYAGLWRTTPSPASEWIGDPAQGKGSARVRYGLKEVILEKQSASGAWIGVAGAGPGASGLDPLSGTWGPAPGTDGTGVAQNRLLLRSTCGFDSFRNTGSEYASWWATQYGGAGGFPCMPEPAPTEICLDFDGVERGEVGKAFVHPDHPGVSFETKSAHTLTVGEPFGVPPRALCPRGDGGLDVVFSVPARNVRVVSVGYGDVTAEVTAETADGEVPVVTIEGEGAFGADMSFVMSDEDVERIHVSGDGLGCITEICAVLPPSPAAVQAAAAGQAHNVAASTAWEGAGAVLEPHTIYRLRITTTMDVHDYPHDSSFNHQRQVTQAAYFRTKGPVGLAEHSQPADQAQVQEPFQCGLEDLTRYVAQTVPPTIPSTGDKPMLPRPVFRAYDVGCVFNENYVDLMYRVAGRDLQILLYDRNNQPVRRPNGAVAVASNPWGEAETVQLSSQETLWAEMIGANDCVPDIDRDTVKKDLALAAAAECLKPDMLYRARLMPLLLHEDFAHLTGALGRWTVEDFSTLLAPSAWGATPTPNDPDAYYMSQGALIGSHGADTDGHLLNPDTLGTALVLGADPRTPSEESPLLWTDYRLAAELKATGGAAMGLAFRWQSRLSFYLFVMDQTLGQGRALYRIAGGVPTLLKKDNELFAHGTNYRVAIEVIGGSIKVWIDDVPIFDEVDPNPIATGTVALHASGTDQAQFADVTVHDLTEAAPSVFGFSFTTSRFVNFQHLVQSHDDDAWPGLVTLDAAALDAVAAHAVSDLAQPISDDEAKAFEVLADDVLGPYARQEAPRVETYRLDAAGQAVGLILRGPEPLGIGRLALSLSRTAYDCPASLAPGSVKLVSAVLGAVQPADEIVSLLIRQSTDLTGWRIEQRDPATPQPDEIDDPAIAWLPIYTFGSEDPAPGDGVMVHVHSGPPPSGGGSVSPRRFDRYRAADGETGDVRLPGDSVDLRLVGPNGRVEHARRFFRDAHYADIAFQAIRKADGTAMILLPAGGALPTGALRLTAIFRRNNRAEAADSLILTEAGDDDDEVTAIDIPTGPPKVPSTGAEPDDG